MWQALRRVLIWTFVVGGVSFSLGFFGPMILWPGSNQGPLLGIFITGPLGVAGGFVIGVIREVLGYTATPAQVLARVRPGPEDRRQLLRIGAAVVGTLAVLKGLADLPDDGGRPAAAAIVVGVALCWYAVAGQVPRWFRR